MAAVNFSIRSQPSLQRYFLFFFFLSLLTKNKQHGKKHKPNNDYEVIALSVADLEFAVAVPTYLENTPYIWSNFQKAMKLKKTGTRRARAPYRYTYSCKSVSFTWSVIATQPPGDARLIECALYYLSP